MTTEKVRTKSFLPDRLMHLSLSGPEIYSTSSGVCS